MEELLSQLNEAQRNAVVNYQGPTMVVAGAGSGKTRVLTYRIAYLINQGVDPFRILALTFTNKAAKEMRERIGNLIGNHDALSVWMGTFHSVFSKILRKEAEKLGYPSNFTIYDTIDAKSLLKTIIKDLNLDPKVYKPNLVYNRISAAKNNLYSYQKYLNDQNIRNEDKRMAKPKIGEIYEMYSKRCLKAGAMDFDDLLFKTYELFKKYPEVLAKYQAQFRYVLVDEYQDTNYAQYLIVKMLVTEHRNICVVGDDAQSIYSFRGADIQNILNFQKDYPELNTFKLEQNYRSTNNIVQAANCIIQNNKDQLQKDVWTDNEVGNPIQIVRTASDNEEGNFVANTIFETKSNDNSLYQDFAVLYRTNAQSRAMEEALRKMNIPYKIYGGMSFYQRKEIKDIIAYFRMTVNPSDEEAFKRVINYPTRGIGKTSIDKIILAANQNDVSLWELISNPILLNSALSGRTKSNVEGFVTMIQSFQSSLFKKNAFELASHIASHTGINKELHDDKTPEGVARYENIQELLNGVQQFVLASDQLRTLDMFIDDIALLTDADSEDEEDLNKVSLMTVHSAKGLEFPNVFIVGMEENLFPSQLSANSRTELEEERRLFYVALTRAEKKAYLSYAKSRYRFGEFNICEKSRFVDEIPEAFVNEMFSVKKTPKTGYLPPKQRKLRPINSGSPKPGASKVLTKQAIAKPSGKQEALNAGDRVEHQRFGKGEIISIDGTGASKKATVKFDEIGVKQLLLKFARLTVVK